MRAMYGSDNVVLMDTTFGTNSMKMPLYMYCDSLLLFLCVQ